MKQRVRTRVRFDDMHRAERNLDTFNEIIIRSTPDIVRDDLVQTLMSLLTNCADPKDRHEQVGRVELPEDARQAH